MWNRLKLLETTQKLPETTQKLPEITWNHLTPAIYLYFLFKTSYSQVEFVLILHLKVFVGQIRLQKLKFYKQTKIWYRGTLLYPHFEFDVYFFEFFVTHVFCASLVPKSEVLLINWNLVQRNIAVSLLRF